jgi:hypothetical protein
MPNPFLDRLKNSNLLSLTVRGMWVGDAGLSSKLETLILSDAVLRYRALLSFLMENMMPRKIVADCVVESTVPSYAKTLWLVPPRCQSRGSEILRQYIFAISSGPLHLTYSGLGPDSTPKRPHSLHSSDTTKAYRTHNNQWRSPVSLLLKFLRAAL